VPQHDDPLRVRDVGVGHEAPARERQLFGPRERGGRREDGRLGPPFAVRDLLGRRSDGSETLHVGRDLGDGIGVREREPRRLKPPGFHLGRARERSGANGDPVDAQPTDLGQNLAPRALSHREHRHHRRDPEDDPERGERRTQLVKREPANRELNQAPRGHRTWRSLSSFPSESESTRSALSAMAGS